jgi:hypothetical protein
MVISETFRRVPEVHELVDQLMSVPREEIKRREAEYKKLMRIRTNEDQKRKSRKLSTLPLPTSQTKSVRRELPFFILLRRECGVSQTLCHDLRAEQTIAVAIVHWIFLCGAIVKAEALLIQVPE